METRIPFGLRGLHRQPPPDSAGAPASGSSVIELDGTDQAIIEALAEDARMSFSEIARRLEVSPGMVRKRYHRLIEDGLVQVHAITNPLLTGRNVWAMVGIKVEAGRLQEVSAQIAAFEEVVYLIVVAGSQDLMAEVFARDHAHLLDFLSTRLQKLEAVRETEVWMNLRIVKETYF